MIPCSKPIIKFLLYAGDAFLMIAGIIVLAIGLNYEILLQRFDFRDVHCIAFWVIFQGSALILFSLLGCYMIKSQKSQELTLALVLFFITIPLLTQGYQRIGFFGLSILLAFTQHMLVSISAFDIIKDESVFFYDIKVTLEDLFSQYPADEYKRNLIDKIQSLWKCCGIEGPDSYLDFIPSSCCGSQNCNQEIIYLEGCYKKIAEEFRSNLLVIIWSSEVIGFLEVSIAVTYFSILYGG